MAYAKDRKTLAFYEGLGQDHKIWQNKPEIADENAMYYEAFQQLNTTRVVTMGGALPFTMTEFEALCRFWYVPSAERWPLFTILRRVDLGYLELIEQRRKVTNGGK